MVNRVICTDHPVCTQHWTCRCAEITDVMPNPEVVTSFDHLVCASDQRGWNLDAERFGSLEVYDKFKLGRLFDRQVSRLRAFKYFIHVGNAAPVEVDNVRSIGHEPTELYKLFAHSHYRQPMLCREVDNAFSLIEKHRARKYENGVRTFSGNRGKCAIQIVGGVHSNKSKVHSQG